MSKRNVFWVVVSLLVMLGSAVADRFPTRRPPPTVPDAPVGNRHDTKFRGVPDSKLQIRAIEYNGSTNGTLLVQIKNPTQTAIKFKANGLYFVPEGNPETAPQRLGAVGPMKLESKEIAELEISPGGTVELALDVFCIDSHRGSPGPDNVFNVGNKRMPKELTATIEHKADLAVESSRRDGNAAARPAAKSRIQSEIWETRDRKWVPLDGEGSQEASKRR